MKFKCLVSGTVVEFVHPVDIESMLAHPQYKVVEEVVVEIKEKKKLTKELE